jgi:hypothetical protein
MTAFETQPTEIRDDEIQTIVELGVVLEDGS